MDLIRHVALPGRLKRLTDGPCPGGTFWALLAAPDHVDDGEPDPWMRRAHDIPLWDEDPEAAVADLGELLAEGCLVWVAPAQRVTGGTVVWTRVRCLADLPHWTVRTVSDRSWCDGGTVTEVLPWLPQFYVVGAAADHIDRAARSRLAADIRSRRAAARQTGDWMTLSAIRQVDRHAA